MAHVQNVINGNGNILIQACIQLLGFIQMDQHFAAERCRLLANELEALV